MQHVYACERASGSRPASSEEALCGCRYALQDKRLVQIKNQLVEGIEIIEVDVAKRSASRRVLPGAHGLDAEAGKADVLRLAPAVVGNAGVPCVVRRQDMGGGRHMDRCITEDPGKLLPESLRYRALSETMPADDCVHVYRSSRADKIVLDGLVDMAVFAVPGGFSVKGLK